MGRKKECESSWVLGREVDWKGTWMGSPWALGRRGTWGTWGRGAVGEPHEPPGEGNKPGGKKGGMFVLLNLL